MIVDIEKFNKAIKIIGNPPFEQTLGWINFKSQENIEYLFFTDDEINPSIACFGRLMRKKGIGKILDIAGEVLTKNISSKQIAKYYSSIISDSKCDMITCNSTGEYNCNFEIGLRRAGFTRPFGYRTCPLTIFVDLVGERKPDRMWKRNLKKAQEYNLDFEIVDAPTIDDATDFVRFFMELKEMKSLSYSLNVDKVLELTQADGYKLFFVSKNGHRLCGRILFIDESSHKSYDVFAANSFESRKYSATHFMMENIFEYLKNIGINNFDFSRVPPSNNETDSVYLFKHSSGGYPVQYNGEWQWSKNKYLPLLFCIYNFFIRRAHNY